MYYVYNLYIFINIIMVIKYFDILRVPKSCQNAKIEEMYSQISSAIFQVYISNKSTFVSSNLFLYNC